MTMRSQTSPARSPSLTTALIPTLQLAIHALVLGFASPAQQNQSPRRASKPFPSTPRLFFLLVSAALSYVQLVHLCPLTTQAGIFGGIASFAFLLKYLDDALLSRWTFEARGPTAAYGGLTVPLPLPLPPPAETQPESEGKKFKPSSATGGSRRWKERIMFGLGVATNPRMIGTPWAFKHLPGPLLGESGKVPGRWGFVVRQSGVVAAHLIAIRACRVLMNLSQDDENSALIRVLGGLIGVNDGLVERVIRVSTFWVSLYIYLGTPQRIFGIAAVGFGGSRVESWIPLFGSVGEARGVRAFWGRFWHQCIRQLCAGPAHWVTYYILRFRKRTILARYTFTTLVFTVSGVIHLVGNVSKGIPLRESGAMQFYVVQAAGIMIEDAFQALLVPLVKPEGKQGKISDAIGKLLWRVAGYLWLAAWLVLTTPVWMDPMLRRHPFGGGVPEEMERTGGGFVVQPVRGNE